MQAAIWTVNEVLVCFQKLLKQVYESILIDTFDDKDSTKLRAPGARNRDCARQARAACTCLLFKNENRIGSAVLRLRNLKAGSK